MRFDLLSFLIGFASASVLAFILYRSRLRLVTLQETAQSQVGSTRTFITNNSETRYYNELVKTLNTAHIAGDRVKLTDIYVEPRFLRLPELPDPTATDKEYDVFHVVPQIHEQPAAYAPYNLDTLTVNDLRNGDRHLALLGLSGAGKSTSLAIIALVAAGEINIQVLDIMSDTVFTDEIKQLPPADRDKAIQQRKELQDRAMQQLRQAQEKEAEMAAKKAAERPDIVILPPPADFQRLLPILVNLRDIDLRPESYGNKGHSATLDPAEPLVKAMQLRSGSIAASTLPRLTYRRLNAGTCLVLIDGYDELPASERAEKLVWLSQFIDTYADNFIIVAGPAVGYDGLLNLKLTPIFLRAWSDADYDRLVQRWTAAWPAIGKTGRRAATIPDEALIRRVKTNNRGRSPLDVSLKIWAAYSDDEKEAGRRGWYDFYVRYRMENAEGRDLEARIAAAMLDQDAPLTRDQMKQAAIAEGKPAGNIEDVINRLTTRSGLLVSWPSGAYSFSHPLLTGFLAAETLASANEETLKAVAGKPAWDIALPFAAAVVEGDTLVNQRLSSAPDLLFTGLFSVASWLPDAATNVTWRAEVFKRLTAALLASTQYPVIRERAMAALVTSRDKSVIYIFQQALRSIRPLVRQLGCIGLGALGETDAIKDLKPMLEDPDRDVRMAAGMALGAIGTETALEAIVASLREDDQDLRQAVAETLAAIPGEGHAVLRDAITHQDPMLRHAAVLGLARVRAGWSVALLYSALLQDGEWYVRNAAEQAFRSAESQEKSSVTHMPEAEHLNWLVTWAASKGEAVPVGPNSRQMLVRALQEANPPLKVASALALANLGYVPGLKPLYGALRDHDDTVRSAAYEALEQMQVRLGEELPAVG